jgi:hypothetical protein
LVDAARAQIVCQFELLNDEGEAVYSSCSIGSSAPMRPIGFFIEVQTARRCNGGRIAEDSLPAGELFEYVSARCKGRAAPIRVDQQYPCVFSMLRHRLPRRAHQVPEALPIRQPWREQVKFRGLDLSFSADGSGAQLVEIIKAQPVPQAIAARDESWINARELFPKVGAEGKSVRERLTTRFSFDFDLVIERIGEAGSVRSSNGGFPMVCFK